MVWTTPRTWVVGEVVTAAEMNAHVRDNLNVLRVLPISEVQYAPTPAVSYSTNNAGVVAMDTTHLRLPSFVGPDSGKVLVVLSGFIYMGLANGTRPGVCVITQGTTTPVGGVACVDTGATASNGHTFEVAQYVTVTAGATLLWDVGMYGGGNVNQVIYASGDPAISGLGAPMVCSVYAA